MVNDGDILVTPEYLRRIVGPLENPDVGLVTCLYRPIPQGWSVEIRPAEFHLDPGATEPVTVTITPPDSFRGDRAFNVNAMYGDTLLGGVTLTVRR